MEKLKTLLPKKQSLVCRSGKKRYKTKSPDFQFCQDFNSYHDSQDHGFSFVKSVRLIAHMLNEDAISKEDAAKSLLILTIRSSF
jgi:hypothetical protein